MRRAQKGKVIIYLKVISSVLKQSLNQVKAFLSTIFPQSHNQIIERIQDFFHLECLSAVNLHYVEYLSLT
jgi:hypothetical protein